MKKANVVLITVAVFMVIAGMAMVFVSFARNGFDFKKVANTAKYEYKKFTFTDDIKSLDLSIAGNSLRVVRSTDGNTYFECYVNDKNYYEASVKNGKLEVEEKNDYKWWELIKIGFDGNEGCVLSLPADKYETLKADIGSGRFECTADITFDSVDVATGSGSIFIDGVSSKDISVATGSGSISLNNMDAGKIYAKTGSGSIKLVNTVTEDKLTAKTGSGSIKLESVDGGELELSTGSGSISGSLKTAKKFVTSTGSGSVSVPENGDGGVCKADTGSGSIKLTVE
ncbi:MAG: DUF4097 family beta strand repeat protein [Lachnospiraceae bacterium]|nr:DUF4097 family beta strand repeat protein [Lachnospiraceae bacterium]